MSTSADPLAQRVATLERTQNETTETLRWVVTKLAHIQATQDQHTQRLDNVEARLEKVETRLEDVETVLGRVETRLEKVETRLETVEAKLDALPRALAELIDASEQRVMAAIAAR